MRLANALLLLCLLLPSAVLPQGKQILEHRGDLEFTDAPEERIIAQQFAGGENRLVLVGHKVVRVLDVASAKFLESHPVDVPELSEDRPRVISPDGRRMIVFGNYDSRRKEDKVKRPPSVWDLQTGKQIATLDKTAKPVRAAFWSKNGKTLATSSDKYAPFNDSSSVEVSFWDGETFAYKNSLPSDKIGWWRLTEDGDRCIYSLGEVKGWIPVIDTKYVNPAGPLSVWEIADGKTGQTVSTRAGSVERKVHSIQLSPDGKFLVLIVQPPKTKDTERVVSVWEIKEGEATRSEVGPKYEIKPGTKISRSGVSFSPSGKYFALDIGEDLQIYETRTGEKRFELPNFDTPSAWITDEVVYNGYSSRIETFDITTGKHLYQQPVIYSTYSYTPITSYDPNDTSFNLPVTEVLDETKIIAHPNGTMFLTYSNQYVKVFALRTGELLQTLVSPPMDYSKKKPELSRKALVYKADWSPDGKTLYVISADRKRVSLWRLV